MLFLHPYLQEQNSAKIYNEFLETLIINSTSFFFGKIIKFRGKL